MRWPFTAKKQIVTEPIRSTATEFVWSRETTYKDVPQWFLDGTIWSSFGLGLINVFVIQGMFKLEWGDKIYFDDNEIYVERGELI